jgi:hypothetical protein
MLHVMFLMLVCATGFTQGSLYSSLEDMLTEPELQKKEKWPIRIATKHLVKPGAYLHGARRIVPYCPGVGSVGCGLLAAFHATSASFRLGFWAATHVRCLSVRKPMFPD